MRNGARPSGGAGSKPARQRPNGFSNAALSGRSPVYIHAGDCWNAGKRSKGITRDQAVQALTEQGVPHCPHCRPDTALGILD